MYFSGHLIVAAILDRLDSKGLIGADTVVISGNSAGGMGVWLHGVSVFFLAFSSWSFVFGVNLFLMGHVCRVCCTLYHVCCSGQMLVKVAVRRHSLFSVVLHTDLQRQFSVVISLAQVWLRLLRADVDRSDARDLIVADTTVMSCNSAGVVGWYY